MYMYIIIYIPQVPLKERSCRVSTVLLNFSWTFRLKVYVRRGSKITKTKRTYFMDNP